MSFSCSVLLTDAVRLVEHLVSAVLLGDEGHKVEDTAGVAPLCGKRSVYVQILKITRNSPLTIPLSYLKAY